MKSKRRVVDPHCTFYPKGQCGRPDKEKDACWNCHKEVLDDNSRRMQTMLNALTFYADNRNWQQNRVFCCPSYTWPSPVETDKGAKAKAALMDYHPAETT